jgi:tripartite-type tricarboxylate transporter receptor subunit TctC
MNRVIRTIGNVRAIRSTGSIGGVGTFRAWALALAGAFLAISAPVIAQEPYPSRPVTIIVPLSAGSQMDILARGLADGLSKLTSQPMLVVNRDGAAATIGVGAVARSKPDGYTLGFGADGAFVIQPFLRNDLNYKVDEFEFICQTNSTLLVFMVGPKSPYKTMGELIEAARKNPGKLNYGTVGHATSFHLLAESIAIEAGIKWNHIPFRVVGDMVSQTLNGTLDFTVSVPNTLNAGGGVIRGLGITLDGKAPNIPPVPLLRDLGYKYAAPPSVIGLYAPKGVPPDSLAWLRSSCAKAVESPSFTGNSVKTLTGISYADSQGYAQEVMKGNREVGELIKRLGITAQ